jgi:DNA-binding CsgD family transcriptional regulator
MYVIDEKNGEMLSASAQKVKLSNLKALNSDLSKSIIDLLSEKAYYPLELAKRLNVNEQKIYYHIRNLESNKIIKIVKSEKIHGAIANYYSLVDDSIVIMFRKPTKLLKLKSNNQNHDDYLYPFINDGKFDSLFIVGSPDPHGPDKARSRDGYYGMDLALFLGTYLNFIPKLNVKLDTETRTEDLKNNNIILIGGPVVNKVTDIFNSKLSVFFDKTNAWNVKSKITNNIYSADEIGIIVKFKNPFNKDKSILLVAGKRHNGTRAAITAFINHFDEIVKGNLNNSKIHAKIVEGIDYDSDGIVDGVEFKE